MGVQSEAFNDDDLDTLDGKGLRARLEAALADRRALQDKVVTLTSEKVLGQGGYDLVSADDLKGVKPEDIESTAKRLQDERTETAKNVVRSRFASQGLEGEELEAAVSGFFGSTEPPATGTDESADPDLEALSRARSVPAGRPTPVVDPSKLHGAEAIAYAIEQQEAKRAKRS
jgi:hypothetical protein